MTENGNNLLTIPEAGEVLRCSETTVKRLLREGALTRIRHPGMRRTYLDQDEIQAFLAGAKPQPEGEESVSDNAAPVELDVPLPAAVLLAVRYRMALEAILTTHGVSALEAWNIATRVARGALDGKALPQTDHGDVG